MMKFIKHSLDHKGWLMAIFVAIIAPLSLGIIYFYFPFLKQQEMISFHKSDIKVEQNIYHKTSADIESDCSSGTDDSIFYLDYHTNMLGLDIDTDPGVIFDTAVWGIALSNCYSNQDAENKSLFILQVLAASDNCSGAWEAYGNTARTFLESYVGDNHVIVEDAVSICARQTTPAT